MGKESKIGIRVLLDEELEWIAGGSGSGEMGGRARPSNALLLAARQCARPTPGHPKQIQPSPERPLMA